MTLSLPRRGMLPAGVAQAGRGPGSGLPWECVWGCPFCTEICPVVQTSVGQPGAWEVAREMCPGDRTCPGWMLHGKKPPAPWHVNLAWASLASQGQQDCTGAGGFCLPTGTQASAVWLLEGAGISLGCANGNTVSWAEERVPSRVVIQEPQR